MIICLDCGAELQILKLDIGFQLVEVTPMDGLRKPKLRKVGGVHKTIQGALNEISHYSLEEYEALALSEMLDVIKSTGEKVIEYFQMHNDYLAQLEQPNY